jgi:ABC-type phosphate transport system substrate-binding protein
MRPGHLRLAIIIALVLGLSTATPANELGFKVIVHPKNPITSIDRELLRGAFLKKETTWSDGETIRPVDLSSRSSVRELFTRTILKKTTAQLRTYWAQQIFSGKGVPPPEAANANDVVVYVLEHPGAVGYVPADVDPRGARVIEVK